MINLNKIVLVSTILVANIYAANMTASFTDTVWNEKKVPAEQVCSDYNMDAGNTPEISLNNVPKNTTKIVLAFSDETFKGMRDGGHGIISYTIVPNTRNVYIPSIEGETFDLPDGFKSETAHRAGKFGKVPGAYLAPCSGGKGNTYSVIIKAVNGDKTLAKTSLTLGIY